MAVALREILALFDVQWDKSSLEAGQQAVDGAIGKLKQFSNIIAGSAIVVGLRNMVTELEAQASALDDSATRIGLTAEELQTYRYAAKMAGLETAAFDQALNILILNQGAAAEGSKAQAEAFKAVGIEAKGAELAQMNLSDLLPQIADGLAKVTSTSERARLAQQLFGKQGTKLAPLLGEGAAGIEKFRKEIDALGGGLSGDGVKALAEYGDQMDRLDMATTSVKLAVAKGIVPTLSSLFERLSFGIGRVSRFVTSVRETTKNSNILTGVFTVLGAAGVGKLFTLAGGWRGIGRLILQASRVLGIFLLRLALPALLIDELITTWQGGDTIIRRILDGWFGEGRTAQIVGFFKLLTGGWESLVFVVDNVAVMVGAIIVGLGAEISNVFAGAWASVQDSAGTAWNNILATVADAVGKVAKMLDSVGLSGFASDLAGAGAAIAGARAKGGNKAAVEQRYWTERTERVNTFEAAKSAIGQRVAEVNAPITNNITVPAGTPASMANRVAQAAGQATQKSRKATRAALVHQVD